MQRSFNLNDHHLSGRKEMLAGLLQPDDMILHRNRVLRVDRASVFGGHDVTITATSRDGVVQVINVHCHTPIRLSDGFEPDRPQP